MFEPKMYASRYIVDVVIEQTYVQLGDSSRAKYYIDIQDKAVMKQFKQWFQNVFAKGIPGMLTVFECKKAEHDGQMDVVITKFINLDREIAEVAAKSEQKEV